VREKGKRRTPRERGELRSQRKHSLLGTRGEKGRREGFEGGRGQPARIYPASARRGWGPAHYGLEGGPRLDRRKRGREGGKKRWRQALLAYGNQVAAVERRVSVDPAQNAKSRRKPCNSEYLGEGRIRKDLKGMGVGIALPTWGRVQFGNARLDK